MIGTGHRDGAGRLSGVAERRRRTGRWSARGEQLFQQLACVTCHLHRRLAAAGRRSPACSARRCSWRTARRSSPTTRYIRESILTPQAKLVAGYQPLMPTFQGLVNEEGVMSLIEYIKSLPAATGRRRRAAGQRGAAAHPRASKGRTMTTTTTVPPRVNYLNHTHDGRVVAADEGPQAHRHPVPDPGHVRVLPRRRLRRRRSASS